MANKGSNWKAKQVEETIVDDSSTTQTKHKLKESTKRKTRTKDKTVTRILSRKRRRLEKSAARKKNQKNRANLVETWQTVQVTAEELSISSQTRKLTSIPSVQTKGLMRRYREEAHPESVKNKNVILDDKPAPKINAVIRKKRKSSGEWRDVPTDDDDDDGDDDGDDDDDAVEVPQKMPPKKVEKLSTNPPKSLCNVQKEVSSQRPTAEVVEVEDPKRKSPQKPVVRKPAVFVELARNTKIQAARLKLPILAQEQQIVELINENPIVIICGETGSGKTTQVPQFLYEAGYALERQIGITEPRRVAAISMSKRVGEEMNLTSKEVSYLIRFESNVTDETKIKFMTDGVLLKEIQSDFLLTKYSVIIIDDAHERTMHTDLVIGYLSRIVPLRHKKGDPLKLVIVSATLNQIDFTENKLVFKETPPVINVVTRHFEVTVHFKRRTPYDYLKEAYRETVRIHNTMPEGGILVFVTGQQEVHDLVNRLRRSFPKKNEEIPNESDSGDYFYWKKKHKRSKKAKQNYLSEIYLDDHGLHTSEGEYDGSSEDEHFADDEIIYRNAQPLWALPLHSTLPAQMQKKVFQPPPSGCRLCIISTSMAESSLTVPQVKYVVDTGRTMMKLYDKITGVTKHVVCWTSKASANQRTRRAGRTQAGHCFRIYSSAVFNNKMSDFSPIDIQQKPIDDVYLQIKSMFLNVIKFPFPRAPGLEQLKSAAHRLEVLGALKNDRLTGLGQTIAKFPVAPRFGKMLLLGRHPGLMPYTILLVAALSVPEVLLERPLVATSAEDQSREWAPLRKQLAGGGHSLLLGDNGVLLKAICAAVNDADGIELRKICDTYGLRHDAVLEIRKLRVQLTNEVNRNFKDLIIDVQDKMQPPSDDQMNLLRQMLLGALGDQIARKIRTDESKFKGAYQANNMEDPVFIHDSSVLRNILPEFVVYQEMYETNKIYMRGITAVDPAWLPVYVPALCNMSDPLPEPPPFYNEETGTVYCWFKGTFGPQAWPLPPIKMPYPDGIYNFRLFAVCLLQGLVFEKLAKYQNYLKSPAAVMTKSWAKLPPLTHILLNGLIKKRIHSKQSLLDAWKEQPNYLLKEYLHWLPQSAHGEVRLLWPPVD